MVIITMSTIGFGAVTPVTEEGMVQALARQPWKMEFVFCSIPDPIDPILGFIGLQWAPMGSDSGKLLKYMIVCCFLIVFMENMFK